MHRVYDLLFVVCACAGTVPYHYSNPGRLDHRVFRSNPEWQRRTRKLVAAAEQQVPLYRADVSAGIVTPGDFGGDPTGSNDSSPAFAAAVAKLLTLGGGRKNGANQTGTICCSLLRSRSIFAALAP